MTVHCACIKRRMNASRSFWACCAEQTLSIIFYSLTRNRRPTRCCKWSSWLNVRGVFWFVPSILSMLPETPLSPNYGFHFVRITHSLFIITTLPLTAVIIFQTLFSIPVTHLCYLVLMNENLWLKYSNNSITTDGSYYISNLILNSRHSSVISCVNEWKSRVEVGHRSWHCDISVVCRTNYFMCAELFICNRVKH